MKVLIIGGTGFISGDIARQAAAAGHEVTLFNRGFSDAHSPYNVINGDVNDILARKKEIQELKPDIVVDSIAYTEQHAKDLVTLFEGTPTRLIVLGSADCYEAFWNLNNNEDTSDHPVREDAETSKKKYYWKDRGTHTGGEKYDKNLMTDVLMDAFKKGKALPTVFRLPFVYGPNDRQYANRHGKIIKHIIDRQTDIVMSGTEQSKLYTYGYVENVAAAIVHSFNFKQTIGKIYNLGEAEVRTTRRWAELYAAQAGHKFNYRILPPEVFPQDGVFNESPQNLILDTSQFRKDTGFKEPVSLGDAIKRTSDWAVKNPDCLKNVETNYAEMKKLADAYKECIDRFNQKMRPSLSSSKIAVNDKKK
jgi:nucleoside-diphosphate-sugar epimerase